MLHGKEMYGSVFFRILKFGGNGQFSHGESSNFFFEALAERVSCLAFAYFGRRRGDERDEMVNEKGFFFLALPSCFCYLFSP